jgi:hypothetical protein
MYSATTLFTGAAIPAPRRASGRAPVARGRGVSAVRARASSSNDSDAVADVSVRSGRRAAVTAALALALAPSARADDELKIISDEPGFGAKAAKSGDLVLVNYVATLEDGTMVDTTLGGSKYFTNGNNQSINPAEARPVIVRVNGADPIPGIPKGLKRGVEGMRVGGVRRVAVPPELGFGSGSVRSPYALIPGGSTVTYEVTVLRLSEIGPDALFKDVAGCGLGGANTMTNGCGAIVPAE